MWVVGAALATNDPLLNAGDGSVSFALPQGDSFIFAVSDDGRWLAYTAMEKAGYEADRERLDEVGGVDDDADAQVEPSALGGLIEADKLAGAPGGVVSAPASSAIWVTVVRAIPRDP